MEIKAILFDLDGTLLPMDQEEFTKTYFKLLAARLAPLGYEPKKLVDSIWAGTAAMVKNDGSCTNEEAFWHVFAQIYGQDAMKDKPCIDAFYSEEFSKAKAVCGFTPAAREVIDAVKEKGKMPVLATNPIFPSVATENRIHWAGLNPEDFVRFTTYENCSHCKPNPKYYIDIVDRIGCKPEECLMVGNDVKEDMVVETVGMKVFLLTDCMINKENRDISAWAHGGFRELMEYLKTI
ncbi:MAG: HAD family hydrolase [Roseburia sp.]|nr:HAD family hydrolase [Roseburia sp.]